MTIASVNYNGPTYANILTTATLAEKWINAHGGVAGHPLQVTTCDEEGDPNKAATCGRQAVANHDVALVGSFTLNGDSIVPILKAADTAWMIGYAVSTSELTSANVLQVASSLAQYTGLGAKAAEDGCKKIAFMTADTGAGSQLAVTQFKNGLKSVNGPELDKTVLVPLTAQDYAPEVTQAIDGADCIMANFGESTFPPFLTAFHSLGGTQRLYSTQGNLDAKVAQPFTSETDGAVVVGSFSDLSLPAWADYRSAIAQYKAPTDENYNSAGGLGTWASYAIFEQIVESMSGPINASTFLAAAQKSQVKFGGVAANIDFAKPFEGLNGVYRNEFNRSITFDVITNGTPKPINSGKFYDMTDAMLGNALPDADVPAAGAN